MKKSVKWILIIVVVLAVIFVATGVFGGNNNATKVATEKAAKRTIIETVTASGNLYPEVEVKISPDISGEIVELNVQEGDSVKKGQVLAKIYADIYAIQRDEAASQVSRSQATVANSNAALEALGAALDNAKKTYDRNKTLFDQKVISKSEFEQYETTLRSAQANFDAQKENIRSLQAGVQSSQAGLFKANKDLSRTTLTAPMDGVISSMKIKKGERVAGNSFTLGTEMMTVADMSVLEVRVDVIENDIVKVNFGDSADITFDAYNDRKFKGIVTQIASSTKTTSGSATSNEVTSYEVRIRLDKNSYQDLIDPRNPKKIPFRPGMNATADIKTKRKDNVLSIPIKAVNARVKGSDKSVAEKKKENEPDQDAGDNTQNNDKAIVSDELEEVVFVLQKDGTVKKTVVKTGIQDIDFIEIISGLKDGDEVVSEPYNTINEKLKDGMKVKVVSKEELFKK